MAAYIRYADVKEAEVSDLMSYTGSDLVVRKTRRGDYRIEGDTETSKRLVDRLVKLFDRS